MRIKRIVFLLFLTTVAFKRTYANPIEEGKALFMSRCAACHNVNKRLTGPALAGVDERRSIEWIIDFVHSPRTMISKGDKQAVSLFEEFNKVQMPDHTDLTADNIKQIVAYIKSETKSVGENKAPFAIPHKKSSGARPLTSSDYGIFIVFMFVVCTLIMVLLFAVKVRTLQKKLEGDV